MIRWTNDFDSYLKWALYHVFDLDASCMDNYEVEEWHSALFGYWYCEVKK